MAGRAGLGCSVNDLLRAADGVVPREEAAHAGRRERDLSRSR
jgi:hypothetical protein